MTRRSYPVWWPAVLWIGVSLVAAVSAFAPAIMATREPPEVRPVKVSQAKPAPSLQRCARDAFGRCKA